MRCRLQAIKGAGLALLLLCGVARADVTLLQSVTLDAAGRHHKQERRVLIRGERMLVETTDDDGGHTALLIDLNAGTMTQADLAGHTGVVYPLAPLRAYVDRSLKHRPGFLLGPEMGTENFAAGACRTRRVSVTVQAMYDLKGELLGKGYVCLLAAGEQSSAEYQRFLHRAFAAGALLDYTRDNLVTAALSREQTALMQGLAGSGGIPLRVDLDSRFTGGLTGRIWSEAANRTVLLTHSVSGAKLDAGQLELAGDLQLETREH